MSSASNLWPHLVSHVFPLSSYKWELLSPKEKILLRKKKEDGEFW